ncbi:cadherin-like domain-containing protein [Marinicella sediminis]|uniref:Cadherin-like domain-containing protein n=1 Tax=Marinicella sediminis TaxID=1792834 RepID=A0ABV7JBY9_9GAMM|nr:Ig-like domain-containing protein [Marinicella sediminis]
MIRNAFFMALVCCGCSFAAWGQLTYDQNITPDTIYGSGNSNGEFTVSRFNGIELGLRAKVPFSGLINSSGDGRYHYSLPQTDHDNNPATANRWNFDWTINTDFDSSNGSELDEYTYELGLDADPGPGVDYLIFDPVTPTAQTPFYDHSIGNNGTANGEGIEATDEASYLNLLTTQNVLQQSWRYSFFPFAPLDTYDPDQPGQYSVYLEIKNTMGLTLARTEIEVMIGGPTFDDLVTPEVIFGTGNSNGNFTIKRVTGIELGLRAKIPFSGTINSTGDGRYLYTLDETNHDNNPGTDNRWNFDWTINTDFDNSNGSKLSAYTYELGMDADPTAATDYLVFDPVTPSMQAPFFDHSIGDNTTLNGGGNEATDATEYLNLLDNNNVLQQSWRYAFFPLAPLDGYNPNSPGTYNVYLAIKDLNGVEIARNEIVVNIISTSYDDNVTPEVIFGTGNSNGLFTINRNNGLELGLRAKIPFSGQINSAGDGRYFYSLEDTDHDNNPGTDNRWNFDWTVNTDFDNSNGSELNQYTYEMGMDADPGPGTDYLIFDPVTPSAQAPFFDHSIGDNNTGNGQGTEATNEVEYLNLLATGNVLQQSWRYAFFPTSPLDGYDPNVPGTYQVYLAIKDQQGNTLVRTEIVVIIGQTYDDLVTPDIIFGSGNVNELFAISRNDSVEVGLRAKIPFIGTTNSNGDGTYSYSLAETDHDNDPGTDNRWNFDWTVNTDYNGQSNQNITAYTYELGMDSDPGPGTDFVTFDPITPSAQAPFFDHAIGDNNTGNGGGTVGDAGTYPGLIANNNVAQNSWRYAFFNGIPPLDQYDPDVPGNYVVYLAVKDGEEVLARTDIQVLIGGAKENTIPVATPDQYSIPEDQLLVVDAFSGLLINDIDADLDTLRLTTPETITMNGMGGELMLAGDGSFVYLPPTDLNGTDDHNYQVTDGVNVVPSSLQITVTPVNDAPDFSILGDVLYTDLDGNTPVFRAIENYTYDYVFGPADEASQQVLTFNSQIVADPDGVLNQVIANTDGFLILELSQNLGIALVEISMQDDGGTTDGGEDTSATQMFSVANLDIIFRNGFEASQVVGLNEYLNRLSFYDPVNPNRSVRLNGPTFDAASGRIRFLGMTLRLNPESSKSVTQEYIRQWLKAVLTFRGHSLAMNWQ